VQKWRIHQREISPSAIETTICTFTY